MTFKGNMEPDINKEFGRLLKRWVVPGVVIVFTIFLLLSLSSCRFFRELDKKEDKKTTDSVNVKKESTQITSGDTSKTKKNETSIKETVYYPQPIIVEGKNGETKVVFVPQSTKETGNKTEETDLGRFYNINKEYEDSLRWASVMERLDKQSETKAKVGPSFIEWILIAAVALLFASKFITIKKP